jgi:hypothetical protein
MLKIISKNLKVSKEPKRGREKTKQKVIRSYSPCGEYKRPREDSNSQSPENFDTEIWRLNH